MTISWRRSAVEGFGERWRGE